MFGPKIYVEKDGFGITLRPITLEEAESLADYMCKYEVIMNTARRTAPTRQDEAEWYKKTNSDETTVYWGIVPDGHTTVIGGTAAHNLHGPLKDPGNGCSTGIILDSSWWGKGVATRAHLGRTWYIVNVLNRDLIKSSVRTSNTASLKALVRVGYRVVGMYPGDSMVMGKRVSTYLLQWQNPEKVMELTNGEGLKAINPLEALAVFPDLSKKTLDEYIYLTDPVEANKRAIKALEDANQYVKVIGLT